MVKREQTKENRKTNGVAEQKFFSISCANGADLLFP